MDGATIGIIVGCLVMAGIAIAWSQYNKKVKGEGKTGEKGSEGSMGQNVREKK